MSEVQIKNTLLEIKSQASKELVNILRLKGKALTLSEIIAPITSITQITYVINKFSQDIFSQRYNLSLLSEFSPINVNDNPLSECLELAERMLSQIDSELENCLSEIESSDLLKDSSNQKLVYETAFGYPMDKTKDTIFIAYLTPHYDRTLGNDNRSLKNILRNFGYKVRELDKGKDRSSLIDKDIWNKLTSAEHVIVDISLDPRWAEDIIDKVDWQSNTDLISDLQRVMHTSVKVPNLNTILEGAMALALGREVYFIYEKGKNPDHFFDLRNQRRYGFSLDSNNFVDWEDKSCELIQLLATLMNQHDDNRIANQVQEFLN